MIYYVIAVTVKENILEISAQSMVKCAAIVIYLSLSNQMLTEVDHQPLKAQKVEKKKKQEPNE